MAKSKNKNAPSKFRIKFSQQNCRNKACNRMRNNLHKANTPCPLFKEFQEKYRALLIGPDSRNVRTALEELAATVNPTRSFSTAACNEEELKKALSGLAAAGHPGSCIGSGEVKWTKEENLTPLPGESVIVGGRKYSKDKVMAGYYENLRN
jgi:hypothetical protein